MVNNIVIVFSFSSRLVGGTEKVVNLRLYNYYVIFR